MSLLCFTHWFLIRIGWIWWAISCRWHRELLRSIDHNEVVLTCVIVDVLLNIVVGILNIVELLLLEIIVVYRCVVVIVILYLDVLSCLGTLGLLLYWWAMLLFASHLGTHVRARRWGAKDQFVWHKEIVEVVLFMQLFIKAFIWWNMAFFVQEVEWE